MKSYALSTLALLLLATSGRAQAQSASVEIWLRAFIPDKAHAGPAQPYITPNPGGSGSIVRLLATAPNVSNSCFATDDRGFDSGNGSSSRLETRFTIRLASAAGVVTPRTARTKASITRKLSCDDGSVLDQRQGSVDRDHIGVPAVANGTVQVAGQIEGRNLLTPLGSMGPAIDYSFDFQWKPETASLTASLSYGSFPAFEVYARQPGGPWMSVLQTTPTGSPWALAADGFGINLVHQVATVTVVGASGSWRAAPPERRFGLDISSNTVRWSETNAAGVVLTRNVPLTELPDGSFKIERPNDDAVLAFLGFQPSLRAEISNKNPKPSFMILKLDGAKLRGDWSGLSVTKDANAHLKELFQPGTKPPKPFDFSRASAP